VLPPINNGYLDIAVKAIDTVNDLNMIYSSIYRISTTICTISGTPTTLSLNKQFDSGKMKMLYNVSDAWTQPEMQALYSNETAAQSENLLPFYWATRCNSTNAGIFVDATSMRPEACLNINSLTSGLYQIIVTVYDRSGNTVTGKVILVIDKNHVNHDTSTK